MKAEDEKAMFRLCEALDGTKGDHFKRHEAIAAALAAAQQEARAAALEEAAKLAEEFDPDGGIGDHLARQLRALLGGK